MRSCGIDAQGANPIRSSVNISNWGEIVDYWQTTLEPQRVSPVHLCLLKNYDSERRQYVGNYSQTIAVQKCGDEPYELALRFAGCNLRCGPCFASGYSWPERFKRNRRVTNSKSVSDVIADYSRIVCPPRFSNYNWLRILGGEPMLNDSYIEFIGWN